MNETPTSSRVRGAARATAKTLIKKISVEIAHGLKPSSKPPKATTEKVSPLALRRTTSSASSSERSGACGMRHAGSCRASNAAFTRSSNSAAIASYPERNTV